MRGVLSFQSAFYAVTAVSGLAGGPTVSWLLVAIAVALFAESRRGDHFALSVALLGFLSALVLLGCDFYYVFKGTISAVYLLDAVVESILFLLWFNYGLNKMRRKQGSLLQI
jgi:hypothetical protein